MVSMTPHWKISGQPRSPRGPSCSVEKSGWTISSASGKRGCTAIKRWRPPVRNGFLQVTRTYQNFQREFSDFKYGEFNLQLAAPTFFLEERLSKAKDDARLRAIGERRGCLSGGKRYCFPMSRSKIKATTCASFSSGLRKPTRSFTELLEGVRDGEGRIEQHLLGEKALAFFDELKKQGAQSLERMAQLNAQIAQVKDAQEKQRLADEQREERTQLSSNLSQGARLVATLGALSSDKYIRASATVISVGLSAAATCASTSNPVAWVLAIGIAVVTLITYFATLGKDTETEFIVKQINQLRQILDVFEAKLDARISDEHEFLSNSFHRMYSYLDQFETEARLREARAQAWQSSAGHAIVEQSRSDRSYHSDDQLRGLQKFEEDLNTLVGSKAILSPETLDIKEYADVMNRLHTYATMTASSVDHVGGEMAAKDLLALSPGDREFFVALGKHLTPYWKSSSKISPLQKSLASYQNPIQSLPVFGRPGEGQVPNWIRGTGRGVTSHARRAATGFIRGYLKGAGKAHEGDPLSE